jgi:hypothetical protein
MAPDDDEARRLHAEASLHLAVLALDAAAAESSSAGRRAVYTARASHLTNDWRCVAMLAARIKPGDTETYGLIVLLAPVVRQQSIYEPLF